jgi:hypothetical protein
MVTIQDYRKDRKEYPSVKHSRVSQWCEQHLVWQNDTTAVLILTANTLLKHSQCTLKMISIGSYCTMGEIHQNGPVHVWEDGCHHLSWFCHPKLWFYRGPGMLPRYGFCFIIGLHLTVDFHELDAFCPGKTNYRFDFIPCPFFPVWLPRFNWHWEGCSVCLTEQICHLVAGIMY